jgi:hypothetical protein
MCRESLLAKRHRSSMRDWAAPLCDTIQQAHRGRFDAEELRNVYAADAVFDDPCGTIRTPKGIVRGFELIHWLCVVDVEPTDDEWSLHPPAAGGLVFSEDAVPTLPAQARLSQSATYILRALPLVRFSLPSTIVLDLDVETRKVTRHEDRWHGRPVTFNSVHRTLKELHGFWFVALFV